ncbi:hypothetical protein [Paraferrimonas haliotis]|uniref:Uncharacterized protein n=1 Tax=Paraferrimonas haliotis TaxID=2013866 RepID=A0AA37TVW3_9GAMM|nr:hypothetical protein [Paraferrimonas haliotis]GLS83740.1 hypothetical protein GCM10007894_17170 [Paraferrimonas haliotis]
MACRPQNELSPKHLSDFLADRRAAHPSTGLSWRPVIERLIVCGLLDKDFAKEVVTAPQKKLSRADNKKYHYLVLRNNQAARLSGINDEDITVYEKIAPPKTFFIGEYSSVYGRRTEFSPASLNENSLWRSSQLDFVSVENCEKSTSKYRAQSLQLLNFYLFDYLPWFFENHDSVFEYPSTPSTFLPHVFVTKSVVMDNLIDGDDSKKVYPCSFGLFLQKVIESNKTLKEPGNTVREALAVSRRYFDFIITRYAHVDGLDVSVNPLALSKKYLGKRRSKTAKATFPIIYWIQFRMFMKEYTKATLVKSARIILAELEGERGVDGVDDEARRLKRKLEEFLKLPGFEHLKNTNQLSLDASSPVNVNVNIALNDKFKFNIQDVEIPGDYPRVKTILLPGSLKKIDIPNYMNALIICVQSYAGQRSSNAGWIDTDNFDEHYAFTNQGNGSGVVPLRIATDKVNPNGLESQIREEVMWMLQFARELRSCNQDPSYTNPIPYQSNPKSPKGYFKPLLQLTPQNKDIHTNMAMFLIPFEDMLCENKVEFDTMLMWTPHRSSPQTHVVQRDKGEVSDDSEFKIFYPESGSIPDVNQAIPFTALRPKTLITPHSLRAQLAKVINLMTDDKELVRLYTGQTDTVIDYYTKPTSKDEVEIKELASDADNVANILEGQINKEDLESSIENRGYIPGFSMDPTALKMLHEKGGVGIALNYTHICPHDNSCPQEIVETIGRHNCYKCPRACMCTHHRVAIGVKIRQLADELSCIHQMLKDNLSDQEKLELHSRLEELYCQISHWKVRKDFIDANPEKFVVGDNAVAEYGKIQMDSFAKDIWARMVEANGAPSLQSHKLKMMAAKVSMTLKANMNRNKPLLGHSKLDEIDLNPVKNVVSQLNMLASLRNVPPEALLETAQHELAKLEENLACELRLVE